MTFLFDPSAFADAPVHQVRRDVAAQIERMIDFLDTLDPDPDLEPELGWSTSYEFGPHDDREGDDERESDPAEWGVADDGGLCEQASGLCLGAVE